MPVSPYNGYFKEIDSPEKAYWLGMMAADGSIGEYGGAKRVSLGLHKKDRYILEQFAETLGYPASSISDKEFHSNFQVSSIEMYNDLFNLGLTQRKSRTIDGSIVPVDYIWPFTRGLFDGDGCVCVYSVGERKKKKISASITGNKPLLEHIAKKINMPYCGHMKSNGCYSITYNTKNALNFMESLYAASCPLMVRKKDKYDSYLLYLEEYEKKKLKLHPKKCDTLPRVGEVFYEGGRRYIYSSCSRCNNIFIARDDKKRKYCSRKCSARRNYAD